MITEQLTASQYVSPTTIEADCDEHVAVSKHAEVDAVRVLHVINGEHYSGAERVQDLLAVNLPRFGYDVTFACVKTGQFPDKRVAQSAELFDIPMRSRFDLRGVKQLTKLIRANGIRIVHAHTPRSALVGRLAAAWARVPMVYHVHSPTGRDSTRRWRNRVNQMIEKLGLLGASRLITVSESLGRYMQQQGYPSDRISIVQNGVPAPKVKRLAEQPSAEWHVGTVALFRPRKGLEVLLDAMATLRRRNIRFRLRAVGPFETPEYEAEIHERVNRLGLTDDIDWIGFTRDVAGELARMDLFVLPSLFGEGLPMVVLEAMASGVPVIGTNVEGVPEAIEDGVTGLIAEPSDPHDLARCLNDVISGKLDWTTLRDNALNAHAKRFSAVQMARGVASVYDSVLRRVIQ